MRRWLVIKLVRWMDRGWTASYLAYIRCDQDDFPRWYRDFFSWLANRIEYIALPLARKLDKDNQWLGAEMAEYGWWG